MKKAIEKISETKRWFFEKINKIDKADSNSQLYPPPEPPIKPLR